MATYRCTEEIKSMYDEKQFEWEISNFYSKVGGERNVVYESPIFTFARTTWTLRLSLKSRFRKWSLYLNYKGCTHKMNLKFEFGFRRVDDRVEQFCQAFDRFEVGKKYSICDWKDSEFSQRKHSLDLNGSLVITCILKHEHDEFLNRRKETSPRILEKFDNLSKDFKKMLNDEDTCDVTLHVYNKTFKAHKFVLVARSPVFAAMFHHDSLEKQTGVINITDCDPKSFGQFLKFLYCGKLENVSFNTALNLYCTSEKYDINELKTFCVEFMKFNLTEDNVCDAIEIADKYLDEKFLLAAQDFFNNNAHKIVDTPKWHTFFQNNFCLANRLICDMVSKIKIPDIKILF